MNRLLAECTVLIVDDTPENIDILTEVLSDYKRKIAPNGEIALKIAQSPNPPDIILLDIMMPGMDGYEVCKILKSQASTKDIPVIFITAMTEVEDQTKGLELGAVDFITKPISHPIVQAKVKNHLELKISREKLKEQNVLLEERNKYITDSINYSKRIQDAILPEEKDISLIFHEYLILFSPKDVVSGDFYYVNKINNIKIAAVIDCTGHGVPGALMSMIGNALLNEIVFNDTSLEPSEILSKLDERLAEELKQNPGANTNDGMDLAICIIDEEKKTITFAGARRPLIYFEDGELKEIKGCRKSIGETKDNFEYQSYSISSNNVSIIYMFSDGLVDQNNNDNKKFGMKNLRTLLTDNYNKSLTEQKQLLQDELTKHQGEEIQRDDITLLAIKLN